MSAVKKPKFRFAPSPNGLLHLGHAYSALITETYAKKFNGEFTLRIEDIDKSRARETFVEAVYRDLKWLGLSWPTPVRRQSEHFDDYKSALDQLENMGLLYPCFATRKEIDRAYQNEPCKPRDPDGALLYPGLYKDISQAKITQKKAANMPFSLRLNMAKAIKKASEVTSFPITYSVFHQNGSITTHEINPERWGDVIIARKDVPTSYHLSVVVDDHLEGITHVTRGCDLLPATDVHRLLQILLRLNEPLYHHHDLITLSSGDKLSKSKQHPSLHDLRCKGVEAAKIRQLAEKSANHLKALLDIDN